MIDIIFYDVDINFYTPYFDELMTNWIMTPIQSIEILKENEEINSFKNSIFYIPKKQSNKEQFIINWSHTI